MPLQQPASLEEMEGDKHLIRLSVVNIDCSIESLKPVINDLGGIKKCASKPIALPAEKGIEGMCCVYHMGENRHVHSS